MNLVNAYKVKVSTVFEWVPAWEIQVQAEDSVHATMLVSKWHPNLIIDGCRYYRQVYGESGTVS